MSICLLGVVSRHCSFRNSAAISEACTEEATEACTAVLSSQYSSYSGPRASNEQRGAAEGVVVGTAPRCPRCPTQAPFRHSRCAPRCVGRREWAGRGPQLDYYSSPLAPPHLKWAQSHAPMQASQCRASPKKLRLLAPFVNEMGSETPLYDQPKPSAGIPSIVPQCAVHRFMKVEVYLLVPSKWTT